MSKPRIGADKPRICADSLTCPRINKEANV